MMVDTMKGMICKVLGHKLNPKVHPVWSTRGPFVIPPGDSRTADFTGYDYTHADGHVEHVSGCVQSCSGIIYFTRICKWCGMQTPIDQESARNKDAKTQQISAVMNGARASYGLPPIDWSD
jgi:hypothetical protein